MSSDATDHELLERWSDGDENAAEAIFQRYAQRTCKLAENMIAQRLKPRFDGEDVVQSVFRTFLRHSRDGDYRVGPVETLWKLLSEIVRNKIRQRVAFHRAQRRSVQREQAISDSPGEMGDNRFEAAFLPTAEDAVALVDEVSAALDAFEPWNRDVLQLCLDGYSTPEIAELLNCSRWSVRRALNAIGHALRARLLIEPPPSSPPKRT